jgi:hypothetical protein
LQRIQGIEVRVLQPFNVAPRGGFGAAELFDRSITPLLASVTSASPPPDENNNGAAAATRE